MVPLLGRWYSAVASQAGFAPVVRRMLHRGSDAPTVTVSPAADPRH
jgi:hypothetical protein